VKIYPLEWIVQLSKWQTCKYGEYHMKSAVFVALASHVILLAWVWLMYTLGFWRP
jgi:hypothetical protein